MKHNSFEFRATSEQQMFALLSTLISMGYKTNSHDVQWTTNRDAVVKEWIRDYPYVVIYAEQKRIGGNPDSRGAYHKRVTTLEELFSNIFGVATEIEVKLNDEYTATVGSDSVTVGCQTFTFDVINKLKAAVDQQIAGR